MKTKIAGDPAIPYKFAAKSRVRILIKFAKKANYFAKNRQFLPACWFVKNN
ncbi:hypothetical protein F542_9370 [Bibersteinia trehalosi USDA-ARS-USMARC-188]|uniref:Uncharacterized protein n=3 Tax=Bibersteinia trehalosi TaxID=47735 RepID=A0A4V7I9E4_BIBTR|nr:hypothetical protein WQG_12670 [Bibersteinia trehalosi USDA-ARS-USMARC-192]AHG81655.1 hypothetical protein F542_9370 [Bibersteinia trehalosi USDA-ARS-USMARC-188]AHG83935.1 hypothetical protein F543_10710 [Bibersteinia trehalosi USDA-ARS-USMARC-189]OAQ14979.1 hypothetical protein F480_10875 [Bibersteinia trehalosi Y31]